MALILAIEPDAQQAAHLVSLIQSRVGADLVLTDTTEQALAAIGDRVPDLILVPALLSPQDDATLAAALRVIAAAAHVQMLTIPVLAVAGHEKPRRGLLARWRRSSPEPDEAGGCDPATFGDQIAAYLVDAAADRVTLPERTSAAAIVEEPVAVSGGMLEAAAREEVASDEAAREAAELEAATREAAQREAAEREAAAVEAAAIEAAALEAASREAAALEAAEREAAEREREAAAREEEAQAAEALELAAREAAALEAETLALEAAARETATLEAETLALEAAARETAALEAAALEAAELEATLQRLTVELSQDPLAPEPILQREIDQPAVYELQAEDLWQEVALHDALVVESQAPEEPIAHSGQLELIELPEPQSFGSRWTWIDLVDMVDLTPREALSRAEEPLAIEAFEPEERLELWMPLAWGSQRAWPILEGVPVEAFERMRAAVELEAPSVIDPVVEPVVEAVIEPVVETPIDVVVALAIEPVVAAAFVPAAPAAPEAPPARPEWLELIESLRLDVERLRTERAVPTAVAPAAVVPPAIVANAAPKAVKRVTAKKPLQDEWGFFDPEQCGFAALLAKLDEITQATDESSARPG